MGETLKVLGQVVPAATTLTALYTVPAATSVTVSSVTICNENASNVKVRLSVAVAGAADATKQYLVYDTVITKNDTMFLTLGITLAATDVVRVQSDTALVSFNLFGVEVT